MTTPKRGAKRGRPKKYPHLTDELLRQLIHEVLPTMTLTEVAKEVGIPRKTLQRHISAYLDREGKKPLPPSSVRPVLTVEEQESQHEERRTMFKLFKSELEAEKPHEVDEPDYNGENATSLDGGRHDRVAKKDLRDSLGRVFGYRRTHKK